MRAALVTSAPSATPSSETVEAALRPAHEAWIEESRTFLGPALEADADVWTRWTAVRYLSDDFESHCRRERELVNELRPFIRADLAERLQREGERFAQLRLEFDNIGRRRGTAAMFAIYGSKLLHDLGAWCTGIERAARGISRDTLPAGGACLLAHLESATQWHR